MQGRFLTLIGCILVCAVPAVGVHGDEQISRFSASWDHPWTYSNGANGICQLRRVLGSYGEVRFIATASTDLGFELQARRDWQGGNIQVTRATPAWHPQRVDDVPLGSMMHIPGGGAIARSPLADQMLLSLMDGFALRLTAAGASLPPDGLQWSISAQELTPALDQFLDCAHTDVRVSWQQLSRTRIPFDVNEHALSDDHRQALAAVARYVKSDPAVQYVYVDGHTDASGTEQGNYKLSRQRAESVAAYLKEQGIADTRIVVRYHGAGYPVADNASVDGKRLNRRTTVRLERGASAPSLAVKD